MVLNLNIPFPPQGWSYSGGGWSVAIHPPVGAGHAEAAAYRGDARQGHRHQTARLPARELRRRCQSGNVFFID